MSDITTFFLNNIWVCLGVGALIIIIVDEVLGVSRTLLADPTDTLPYDKNIRDRTPPSDIINPLDRLDEEEDGPSVEDMLRPK
jgi:hypothetical protein